jgi:hypothetical protein
MRECGCKKGRDLLPRPSVASSCVTVIFRVQFLSFQPTGSHLGWGLSMVDEIFIKSVQYQHSGSVAVQLSVHNAELVFSLNVVIASLPALRFFS